VRALLPVALVLWVATPQIAASHPSAAHRIELLSEAIRAHPDDPRNYMRRGEAYSNEGYFDLALADLKKAEALGDPVHVAYDLGVLHYRMGKLAEARSYFDAFLARFPDHPPALQYRARVRRDAGDHAGALSDFRAYFEKNPRANPGDYVSAARLLAGPEGEGVPAALAMLDQGIARLGAIPQLQRYAIELERSRSNLPSAIARLESLEKSLGRSPDYKVDMGELLLEAGRPEDARVQLDAAADQLDRLPVTGARTALRQRLHGLQAKLAASPS
jgi:tetratricopeptide (TPR) repeat protein